MGALPGLVGAGGGAGGTSFNVQNPLQPGQLQSSASGVGNSLQSQQALLQALQAQNGIGNQSQVYGQLQGIASGAVNPAQAQFAQNTQANVANQAALMAGQRGASSNVGLIARQAAQQGAATQQQAVGQEATQQAQNQIAAIGQAGNLASTQAAQQIGATATNTQANLANQGQALGAAGQYNAAQAGLAGTQMQGQQALIGGALNGAGVALGHAAGGDIVKMADGGDPAVAAPSVSGPASSFGQFMKGMGSTQQLGGQVNPLQSGMSSLVSALGSKKSAGANVAMPNGSVAGPSNNFGAPQLQMPEMKAQGGATKDFRTGGKVDATSPKEKAVKGGNSYANDKIPAVLSEHEIVLPRSVTLSKDPVGDSAKFVASVIAKRRGKK